MTRHNRTSIHNLNAAEKEAKAQGFIRLTFGYNSNETVLLDRAIRQLGPRDFRLVPNSLGQMCIWTKPSHRHQSLTHALPDSVRAEAWAR